MNGDEMVSAESAYLAELYSSWTERAAAHPDMSLAANREMLEEWHRATVEPTGVSYDEIDADGVPSMWCIPTGGATDRAVLYLHGGGFMFWSYHSHRKLAGHLAKAIGAPVLVPDYRRAPRHRAPAQLDDAVTAYHWIRKQGIDPHHIATAGDSAGGNLCIAVALKLRADGEPLPAAIMPISPWLDMELESESLDTNADHDKTVNRAMLETIRRLAVPDDAVSDPLINLLYADPAGLPPILIHVSSHEALLDDSIRFAVNARSAGVDMTVEIEHEMQHIYPCLAGRAPEADRAIARMGTWVRPLLGLH
ncbi:alpha/beta hydrolase [Rhodococcus sp. NPDC057529]|uniref:alpha/beta hydrolase n=1 Tax=Rhodococcus sp. NPDC057529 TaxID=3346158 RepID=UPI00367218E9